MPSRTVSVLALHSTGYSGHSKAQIGVFAMGASLAGKEQDLNDVFNTFTEAVQELPAGGFLLEDGSGYLGLENDVDELLIKEN
jgi:hypothetical protein